MAIASYFQYIVYVFMLIILAMAGFLIMEYRGLKKIIKEKLEFNHEAMKLKLQALERLTIYTERAGLQNLIGRIENLQTSAFVLHQTLTETLRVEYEYNASQQIYVSPEIWAAITRLKEQNTYVINQLAATLPVEANAMDLSKRILEFGLNQQAELSNIVLNALKFEAQKILN